MLYQLIGQGFTQTPSHTAVNEKRGTSLCVVHVPLTKTLCDILSQ